MEWVVLLLLMAGAGFAIQWGNAKEKARAEQRRREILREKYRGSPFVEDICGGMIRPGMTVDQLVDAWGMPAGVEERVLKTKVVHTYKYAQTGARSFRQRVKVENGIVVGWTQN